MAAGFMHILSGSVQLLTSFIGTVSDYMQHFTEFGHRLQGL